MIKNIFPKLGTTGTKSRPIWAPLTTITVVSKERYEFLIDIQIKS